MIADLLSNLRRFPGILGWTLRKTWQLQPFILSGILISSLMLSLTPAALAWIARNLINETVTVLDIGTPTPIFVKLILAAVGFSLFQEIARNVGDYLKTRQTDEILRDLTIEMLDHSSKLDYAFFEDPEMQNVIERAQSSTVRHFTGLLDKTLTFATITIEIISLVAVLFILSPLAVVSLLGLGIPYGLYQLLFARRVYNKEFGRTTKRRWSRYHISLLTNYKTLAEIKLLNLARELLRRYKLLQDEFVEEDRKLYSEYYLISVLFGVIFTGVYYFLFFNIARTASSSGITIGDITLFTGVALKLRSNMERIGVTVKGLTEELLYIGDLRYFLSISPSESSREQVASFTPKGEIVFENVSFQYPGSKNFALRQINLHILPGETVAFVGKNGSGKSTLVNLLAKLYHPNKGRILVDGTDIELIDTEHLHRQIAYVRQDFNRYEASVFDNIRYGDADVIENILDIQDVSRYTGVEEIVDRLPEAYDTLIGRRFGTHDLSGGMWQKLAVTRMLARTKAQILILDEPTSTLDVHAEWKIFQQFKEMAKGRTTIIISHRFTTVSMADRIILINDGQIVETGTHNNLLQQGGQYASMYHLYNQRLNI